MANRIPLIVDTLNDNKIKELPIGDNLDLGGAGITNAGTINATDVIINNVSFNNPFSGDYNDLTNKPVIPTVPTVLSDFTNDIGYHASGTTTDQINEVKENKNQIIEDKNLKRNKIKKILQKKKEDEAKTAFLFDF